MRRCMVPCVIQPLTHDDIDDVLAIEEARVHEPVDPRDVSRRA